MKGRLVALSSAAVLAIYTAGYARTRSAAEMLEAEERRPQMPRPGSVDRTPIPAAPVHAGSDSATPSSPTPEAHASAAADRASAPAAPENRPDAATQVARTAAAAASSQAPAPSLPAANDVQAARQRTSAPVEQPSARRAESAALPRASAAAQPVTTLAAAAPAAAVPVASTPVMPLAAGEAPPAPLTPTTPAAPAGLKWKDGHYTGWGTCRHGDIQASVFIENGKIATASIAQCLTRYPCDWIRPLPPQVVQRQSAETDIVSGATESTNAFYYAVLEALGKASK